MSFFGSLSFYVAMVIVLVPHVVLGLMGKRQRVCLFVTTLLMVGLVMAHGSKTEALSLVLYVVYQLAVVYGFWAYRKAHTPSRLIYRVTLILAMLPVVVVKLPVHLPYLSLFGFLGISYVTFRSIQMIVEMFDGTLTRLSLMDVLTFWLFFPSFSSGPIDRSRRFEDDLLTPMARPDYVQLLGKGLWKILLGLTYKFAFSTFFFDYMNDLSLGHNPLKWVLYAYVYGFYLFFDFAGYSLLAVGTAYVMGVRLPDNFRLPFISRDMKEFWDRWHITLSHWLRDYLFTRFVFQSLRQKRFNSRLQTACAGFIVNMMVMGFWHGVNVHYVLYGLYHGLLLAGNEVYQKKSAFYKKHKSAVWYQALSWFVTLNLVMAGFLVFSGRLIKI